MCLGLGLHAARGDYGGCDSATVARLGSHDARVAGGAAGASQQLLYMRHCAAPQILFIYMAAALSTAGLLIMFSCRRGQYTLFMRSCYLDVRYMIINLFLYCVYCSRIEVY